MQTIYFRPKVDWWVYAVVVFTIAACFLGPLLSHEDYIIGAILAVVFTAFEIFAFASIKYAIRGDELGVSMFFCWKWYPIDKIAEIKKTTGILSAPALSVHRVAIKFSDRSILKSAIPLEISPIRADAFIDALTAINPTIKTTL